jgi:hypothetical protein
MKTYKETALKNTNKYFTCLVFPWIPSDNNKAERAIKPLVLKRKNCYWSKTQKWADISSVLMTVCHTLWNQSKTNFFSNYINILKSYWYR